MSMKPIGLKSYGDAMGTIVDVEVYFSAPVGKVIDRLIQVAAILKSNIEQAKGEHDTPVAMARLVDSISTDFAAGHVVVRAVIPEGMTSEQVQRDLMILVPPFLSN